MSARSSSKKTKSHESIMLDMKRVDKIKKEMAKAQKVLKGVEALVFGDADAQSGEEEEEGEVGDDVVDNDDDDVANDDDDDEGDAAQAQRFIIGDKLTQEQREDIASFIAVGLSRTTIAACYVKADKKEIKPNAWNNLSVATAVGFSKSRFLAELRSDFESLPERVKNGVRSLLFPHGQSPAEQSIAFNTRMRGGEISINVNDVDALATDMKSSGVGPGPLVFTTPAKTPLAVYSKKKQAPSTITADTEVTESASIAEEPRAHETHAHAHATNAHAQVAATPAPAQAQKRKASEIATAVPPQQPSEFAHLTVRTGGFVAEAPAKSVTYYEKKSSEWQPIVECDGSVSSFSWTADDRFSVVFRE